MTAQEFLQSVKDESDIDDALDIIYSFVGEMCREKKYDFIDKILAEINVKEYDATILIGFLTTSLWCKKKLCNRRSFYGEVEMEIKLRNEWTDGLLSGLEH